MDWPEKQSADERAAVSATTRRHAAVFAAFRVDRDPGIMRREDDASRLPVGTASIGWRPTTSSDVPLAGFDSR